MATGFAASNVLRYQSIYQKDVFKHASLLDARFHLSASILKLFSTAARLPPFFLYNHWKPPDLACRNRSSVLLNPSPAFTAFASSLPFLPSKQKPKHVTVRGCGIGISLTAMPFMLAWNRRPSLPEPRRCFPWLKSNVTSWCPYLCQTPTRAICTILPIIPRKIAARWSIRVHLLVPD